MYCLPAFVLLSAGASAQDNKPFAADQIKRGAAIYATNCQTCHGARMANPEWATDLRTFPKDERSRFVDSVTYGKNGMPPWGDVLKRDDMDALWAYVVAGEGQK